MTLYIPAYDVESPACLAGCRRIVEVHRSREMPATFFTTGEVLAADPDAYRDLLDDPLFEVASHSYSHKSLRDHPFCGPAVAHEEAVREIEEGKAWVERVFRRRCAGFRPACGFPDGLRGAPELLEAVSGAGFLYVSSAAWDVDFSLPAPLREPFNYAPEGFPQLWELPANGWHENLLKDHNRFGPRRLTLWPPRMPEAIPSDFLTGPEEEFQVNRVFLEAAAEGRASFVSLVWHPWSLHRMDPQMEMLELTFDCARRLGLEPARYVDLYELVSDG